MNMHPARKLLDWLPEVDFAILSHGFQRHGRDYAFIVQDCLGGSPGEHEVVFTHCVRVDYQTRVHESLWNKSWDDLFLDHEVWKANGEPEGFVWGTNWSNAYPGLKIVEDSSIATEWSERIGKAFHEVTIETERFFIRVIFHDVRHRKLSDDVRVISAVTIPMSR